MISLVVGEDSGIVEEDIEPNELRLAKDLELLTRLVTRIKEKTENIGTGEGETVTEQVEGETVTEQVEGETVTEQVEGERVTVKRDRDQTEGSGATGELEESLLPPINSLVSYSPTVIFCDKD